MCLESARPDTPRGHMDWSLFCLYFNWEYLSNLKFHQIPGVQRLRCYPFRKTKNFAGRTFHGKNQQDVVALIPSDVVGSDFQYDGKLEAARIQLFFEFTLLPHSSLPQEEPQVVECAFIQNILPFADSVNKPLFKHGEFGEKEGAANI